MAGTPAQSVRGGTTVPSGNHGAGGDDGAFADAAAVEDHRAHADQHRVLNHAAVDGGVVANGHPVAHDDRIEVALAVEHGAVLHVGVGADADGVHVAAQNGVHPHRGMLAEGHVADELRGKINVATGGNLGQPPLVAANHGSSAVSGVDCNAVMAAETGISRAKRDQPGGAWLESGDFAAAVKSKMPSDQRFLPI